MIVMRPITEQAVLDELCAGRFAQADEALAGYIVMDGAQYLGHMLYYVEDGVTTVLDCGLTNTALVDGAVRACVAAGENAGASQFVLNTQDSALKLWCSVFLKDTGMPAANDKIFHQCK